MQAEADGGGTSETTKRNHASLSQVPGGEADAGETEAPL